MERTEHFLSGFCAVVGRPNVGKSTLLNRIVGQKVTIVSDKPQTTRNTIQCVYTTPDAQIVFLDTPGIHRPQDRLGERMVQAAHEALSDVDVVLFVVDGPAGPGKGDRVIAARLGSLSTPVGLVVNKVDMVSEMERPGVVAPFTELAPFAFLAPISARTGEGVDGLLLEITARLPRGPKYYPDDWVSDQPEQFIAAELIREKAIELTRDELPYALAVTVDQMAKREGADLVDLSATIYVERESQKGIVIGRGGGRLKEIGTLARRDIERLLGTPINLQLWVKVSPNWREKERQLRAFGYP